MPTLSDLKKCLFVIPFLLLALSLKAEPPHDKRTFSISASQRVHHLDSLSIVAESFRIYGPDDALLDPAFYRVDFVAARLTLRIPEFWRDDSLVVEYRVWPVNFAKPVFSRDTSLIRLPGPGEDPIALEVASDFPEHGLLRFEGLESSGSITRGLTMGNKQDASLNSAMNLQLSGMLTEDIEILSVVSDQNIPFQPEGTTQQIQDFDRVFIQLSGFGGTLTAGDFELEKPPGHFLYLNRKARGGKVNYQSQEAEPTVLGGGRISATAAGAISRGKYARNEIQGMEGNQGPYRLTGTENESFILILAGTERVFVDGQLLQRGMDHDYVIDYNTAEITFMSTVLINRESRIIVEFEYAERNYARSMVYASTELEYDKVSFRLNFFNEQDHRNQPLYQELSEERKAIMAAAGDSLQHAFDWNIDSTGFENDRVMYRLTDSLGFDTVFVYSTDADEAVYQLGFTFVGEGNGNYRQVNTSANGRVYEWVAPQNGIPQGTHEPIARLVTPKKHQMLTLGGDIKLSENSFANIEYALSNRDLNLFSDLHKENQLGHAFRIRVDNKMDIGQTKGDAWELASAVTYEMTNRSFTPLERYRDVEFNRDWNLPEAGLEPGAEHMPGLTLSARHSQRGSAQYDFRAFVKGEQYQGLLHKLSKNLNLGRNKLAYYGSLLNSSGIRETSFYRHRAAYSRDLGLLTAGVEHLMEDNRFFAGDSLSRSSFNFDQWEVYVQNPDTSVTTYRAFYKHRIDGIPRADSFETASIAGEYGVQYRYSRNPNHRIGLRATYRELQVQKETYPGEQSERTLNGRIDYNARWGDGVVTSRVFYETASGRERKREYMYVEVPPGQGVYVWNDYNGNGIMELDEFEVAPYPDEANFIRVFIPTDEFIPVYSTAVSHSVNIDPAVAWRDQEGWRKFMSRFSNRLNYRIDNRKQGGLDAKRFNPFLINPGDTLLISLNAQVRNALYFNRAHPVYSIEWTFQENRNKNLMSNGFESRQVQSNVLRTRVNISRMISFQLRGDAGQRINESEFFARRNYHIRFYELEPSMQYQPGRNIRLRFIYGYMEQKNLEGNLLEKAGTHSGTIESRWSFPAKGNLQLRYQVSQIDYPYDLDTPVAFEILQGLREGTNHLWNINWQHNLNEYMQLNLNYHGRKPPDVAAIHTGTVQLRAFF